MSPQLYKTRSHIDASVHTEVQSSRGGSGSCSCVRRQTIEMDTLIDAPLNHLFKSSASFTHVRGGGMDRQKRSHVSQNQASNQAINPSLGRGGAIVYHTHLRCTRHGVTAIVRLSVDLHNHSMLPMRREAIDCSLACAGRETKVASDSQHP